MATVHVANGRQKRMFLGHPWVYKTEIARIDGEFQPGDIVDVVDFREKFIGRGYINPNSMITVRMLTNKKEELINDELIIKRVENAWNYRQKVVQDSDSDSYRVIFGEADLLPGIIVDKFGDYLVVQSLTMGIDKYQDLIIKTLDKLLKPKGIYEKNDDAVRKIEGLPLRKGFIKGQPMNPVPIKENGIKILVDIVEGQKTGYFLDQRENRKSIAKYVKNAKVLDCFCHVGSFALHAGFFGAQSVLGLDISQEAIANAVKNAVENNLDQVCQFQAVNAFDKLRELEKEGELFDTIVLDPPAFTKSKSAIKGAIRGYKEINLRAMKLLPPGGILITNSCSYYMSEDLYLEIILEAAKDIKRKVRIIELRRQAPDHPMLMGYPESYYLKCFILQIL